MNRALVMVALSAPLALAAACGGGDDDAAPSTADAGRSPAASSSGGSSSSGTVSSSGGGGSSGEAGRLCHATPQGDDALRFMVSARPYASLSDAGTTTMAKRFSTFSLTSAGIVTELGEFELGGYNTAGRIAFTPDGRLGAVALESRTQQDRGTVGVFRLDDAGQVTVVHANYKAAFFAAAVAFSPDGAFLYVSSDGTANNGGGLYAIPVGCDGTLGESTRILSGAGTTPPFWAPSNAAAPWRALVASNALEGAGAGQGLHLITFDGVTAARLGSVDAFGQQTLINEIAWAADGTHALLVAPNPNIGGQRVIGVRSDGEAPVLDHAYELAGAETVVASPYGNSFFIALADPDGMARVSYASTSEPAFAAPETVVAGVKPQLPFAAHAITRGALKGRIVFAELDSIRQLQFDAEGDVSNVSQFKMPSAGDDDFTAILGAFGLTL